MPPKNHSRHLRIIATIIALVIVGGSIWYTQFRNDPEISFENTSKDQKELLKDIRGVQSDDHVRGNPDAKLVFIVYSDFGCPFCNKFHKTMEQIIEKYGRSGDVAWVFRHVPLVQLHPQANVYALASECVAKHAGNQGFWKFSDSLFDAKKPDSEVSAQDIVTLAQTAGVGADTFTSCMESNELQDRVTRDFDEARAAGAEGSPYTVIVTPNDRVSFGGARPYVAVASATETILKTIGITTLERPDTAASASDQFTNELRQTPPPAPILGTTTSTTSTSTQP
jgi:protein-disulfide isomerase